MLSRNVISQRIVEILAKAAKIIRNDIFDQDWFKFNGCFPPECQEDSLPTSLKSLVSLILSGPIFGVHNGVLLVAIRVTVARLQLVTRVQLVKKNFEKTTF